MARQVMDMQNDKLGQLFEKTDANFSELYSSTAEHDSAIKRKAEQSDLEKLKNQVDANVAANTDKNADYAAEVVNARVGEDGTVYPSLGEAMRGQIAELKGDLAGISTKTPASRNLANPAEFTRNKIIMSWGGTGDSPSGGFYTGFIPVSEGDKVFCTIPSSIAAYDAEGNFLEDKYMQVVNPNAFEYYLIENGVHFIRISGYGNTIDSFMVNIGESLIPYEPYIDGYIYEVMPSVLPEIPVEKVPDIGVDKIIGFRNDDNLPFTYKPTYTMSKGYIYPNGKVTETETHKHTSKINVNAGDLISIISPKKANIRFLCAFDDGDHAIVAAGSATQIYSYVVPDGIASVVLTIENQYDGYYSIFVSSSRKSSGANYISRTEFTDNNIAVAKNKINTKLHEKVTGSVNSESGMRIDACCCQSKTIMFRGNITSFSDLVIGLSHNGSREIYCKIDAEKVTLYNVHFANPVVDAAHGLTINDYICVTISTNYDNTAKITIATLSGVFSTETNNWLINPAEVFVETDSGSELINCELIFSLDEIRRSIWVFGDSYMSYSDNRVLYWLKMLGASDFCINALPGEASDRAMTDLMYMLEYSTPSKIIWNMGMNDPDKNGVVNPNWQTCFNLLKQICSEKGIELILYTVPSVPTVDNTHKNGIIRSSGYKYSDGENAVGASAAGVWKSGMLSDDGVHPSTTGAIAIAQEMILAVPELLLS